MRKKNPFHFNEEMRFMVHKVVNEYDAEALLGYSQFFPGDEYCGEAGRICGALKHAKKLNTNIVSHILCEVMNRSFGRDDTPATYRISARRILGLDKSHECPVCRKHTFPERNSHDTCPECGWIDFQPQDDYPGLEIAWNPMCVYQAQVVYHHAAYCKRTGQNVEELQQVRVDYTTKVNALMKALANTDEAGQKEICAEIHKANTEYLTEVMVLADGLHKYADGTSAPIMNVVKSIFADLEEVMPDDDYDGPLFIREEA